MPRWHALWLKPDLSPEIEHEVNIERQMIMARHQPVAAPAHAVNSLILAIACWPYLDQKIPVLALVALFQITAIWQLIVWWKHRNVARPSRVTDRTITRATVWSIGLGGVWGIFTAVLLLAAPSREVDLLIFTIVAGICAGGTMMLYAVPASMVMFLIACTVPPWLVSAIQGDRVSHALMAYTFVYLGFLLVTGRYSYRGFIEGVRLRMLNAELAYKADAANRAKSRFLANMSHELRKPLNAIIGFAEVIHNQFKGQVGNPQYVEFARSIHESGRHLVGIINDILDLSKVEAGKVELEEEAIAPAILITQVTSLMAYAFQAA